MQYSPCGTAEKLQL